MSRSALPLAVNDLAAFARSVREQYGKLDHPPGHVETLNILCRAAGFRNFQQFRVLAAADARPAEPVADQARVEKTARHFDREGRLVRWPAKASQQELCLWALWARIPPREVFTERAFGDLLTRWHLFGDTALLRRALFSAGLVHRSRDGREYRRIERKPVAELSPLLAVLRGPAAA
ncbi:DUF2087 domain-containing protein [Nitrospirillum sp. BR 11163]|uniref:DUF2087 domain-containing protein n=1 Tax=Nitrospirillum sp. BR 11163 TaxID=3104323 RepID=UPI002AFE1202|nr:DUF2087 domain-containing protein [Nitrospirillum sp. BR 11163]MEA1672252.1 DUF2087 domain-containing protein [Nitrospirillum sp. BR 11163]